MINVHSFYKHMKRFSKLVRPNVYTKNLLLSHYTTPDALISIVKNDELWATHFKYLNDYSEISWGVELILKHINKIIGKFNLPEKSLYVDKLNHYARSATRSSNIYIFSMSNGNNILNQWRYYGDGKLSYAIDLQISEFPKEPYEKYEAKLFEIIYKKDEQDRLASRFALAVEHFILRNEMSLNDQRSIEEFIFELHGLILHAALHFKNPAFEAESEWRFVFVNRDDALDEHVEYRNSKFGIIPYLPIKDIKSSFRRITLSPSANGDISEKALRMYLDKNDLENVFIDRSDTTFR